MTEPETPADEALIRRLREAIGPETAADMNEQDQLDEVLRLLLDQEPRRRPPDPPGEPGP